ARHGGRYAASQRRGRASTCLRSCVGAGGGWLASRPWLGLPSGRDPAHPGAALRQEAMTLAQALTESASRASGLVHWDRTVRRAARYALARGVREHAGTLVSA